MNTTTNQAPEGIDARLIAALRFYADGHHFVRHDETAWDTVSGEPQNFLEDEANTATVEDGSVAKAAIASAGEFQLRFDLQTALTGVAGFFDGEFHRIKGIVSSEQARGQRQEDECQPEFDHCFVDQDSGGYTGDDFHGTVYFHIGDGQYLAVEF